MVKTIYQIGKPIKHSRMKESFRSERRIFLAISLDAYVFITANALSFHKNRLHFRDLSVSRQYRLVLRRLSADYGYTLHALDYMYSGSLLNITMKSNHDAVNKKQFKFYEYKILICIIIILQFIA